MRFVQQLPEPAEYIELRDLMGWGRISPRTAETTLDATTFCVCARDGQDLVGLVRFLGDGCLYLYLSELMVHPQCSGRGIGSELMRAAIERIDTTAERSASVTLLPLAGLEGLYERFGFEPSPCGPFGHGMAYRRHMIEQS